MLRLDNCENFNGALSNLTGLFVGSHANIETIKIFTDPDSEELCQISEKRQQ